MTMKKYLLLTLLLCSGWAATAQQYDLSNLTWTPREDLNQNLPASIKVYETNTTIKNEAGNEIPINAFYTIADLKAGDVTVRAVLSTDGAKTPTQFYQETGEQAYLVTNGGYFGGSNSYSLLVDEGKILSDNISAVTRTLGTYYPTRGAFGLDANGTLDIAWVYSTESRKTVYSYPAPSPNNMSKTPQPKPTVDFPEGGMPWEMQIAIGGGPILVNEGVKVGDYEAEAFQDDIAKSVAPRTCIGYTADGKVISFVADGRQTHSVGLPLPVMTDIMISLGCVEVLNLDGGGSSAMAVNGELLNKPSDGTQRAVPTALMFVKAPTILDTESTQYFERGTASFSESGAAGAYGTSATRTVATADKPTAEGGYTFPSLQPGKYSLYSWWAAETDMASAVPYSIVNGGLKDTISVTVDQSVVGSGGQFNPIGEFHLSEKDTLLISNNATGGNYISIDAIKLMLKEKSKCEISFLDDKPSGKFATGETVTNQLEIKSPNSGIDIAKITLKEKDKVGLLIDKQMEGELETVVPFTYQVESTHGQSITLEAQVTDTEGTVVSNTFLINVDNTPPIIEFTENDRDELAIIAQQDSTITYELVMLAITKTRPIKTLKVFKQEEDNTPELLETIDLEETLSQTYTYGYTLNEQTDKVKLLFELSDVLGVSNTATLSMTVEGVEQEVTAIDVGISGKKLVAGPIPIKGLLNISSPSSIQEIKILSADGKLLYQEEGTFGIHFTLPEQLFPAGASVIHLQSAEGTTYLKVIR
ncbi:phosphodiester glycosidase family protein [Limibacter armeniacum]|uniref:phosphodiester glycosidase family protein n=1 Tax=Limibacter armeniacum TaxID=466084 RepID=UPI002FE628E7